VKSVHTVGDMYGFLELSVNSADVSRYVTITVGSVHTVGDMYGFIELSVNSADVSR
jgi:hypothetical protein